MNARERAKQMIEPYVLRGDDLGSMMSGNMGYSCSECEVSIGGYCFTNFDTDKQQSYKLKRDEIGVVLNKTHFEKFKLKNLFNEILSPESQLQLF